MSGSQRLSFYWIDRMPRLPVTCSFNMPSYQRSSGSTIKVVVNGACSPVGKAAISAITKARGMEIGGAVDTSFVGRDAGEVAGLEEPLELPISSDLVMVMGSLSQEPSPGVMVDLSNTTKAFENVRQATAFGLRSVVTGEKFDMDKLAALSTFCSKASTGCLVAPTLSIGSVLLQQAATAAGFYYKHAEIVEARGNSSDFPTLVATLLAESISGVGQQYNKDDASTDNPARGVLAGDGVRLHSLSLPGIVSRTSIYFSAPGEVLTFHHDMTDVEALMPGLLIAIRRVVRLESLVYGLEKVL